MTNKNNNNVNLNDLETRVEGILYKNFKRGLIFLFVFLIFSINLFSVSLALQCNAGKGIFYRISSALFAFMFGFIFLFFSFLFLYRHASKQQQILFEQMTQ